MTQSTAPRLRFQIFQLRHRAVARPALGLDTLLPEAIVRQVLKEEGATWRCIFYTPWLTFWAFFWQVLSPDRSCRAAVKRIAAWMARRGEAIDDEDTGPYCKARARLPEAVPLRLMRALGREVHEAAPRSGCGAAAASRWSTARRSACPTPRRTSASTPRAGRRSRGWGSRSRGWWSSSAWRPGRCWRRPSASARGSRPARMPCFAGPGTNISGDDVSLGDRGFSSYFDIALLKRRGVDSVCRLHQARASDYRVGRRLGKEDHIVTWPKPARPDWMDEATYQSRGYTGSADRADSRRDPGVPHPGAGRGDDAFRCGCLHEKGSC